MKHLTHGELQAKADKKKHIQQPLLATKITSTELSGFRV